MSGTLIGPPSGSQLLAMLVNHQTHDSMHRLETTFARMRRKVRALTQASKPAAIYSKYRHATMIPKEAFLDNLDLMRRVAERSETRTGSAVECGTWRGGMSAAMIDIM